MNAESKQQQNQDLNRRFTSKTGLTAASGPAISISHFYVSAPAHIGGKMLKRLADEEIAFSAQTYEKQCNIFIGRSFPRRSTDEKPRSQTRPAR